MKRLLLGQLVEIVTTASRAQKRRGHSSIQALCCRSRSERAVCARMQPKGGTRQNTARGGVIEPEFARPRAGVVLLEGETRTMPTPERPSLIVRQKSPQNIEFPFASLSDWLIPTELIFVRNHFASPDLDARDWRLRVGGAVERPIELDLDSIKAMRSTTFTAVVECAGNGRVYYEPPKEGLQWQNGAVGNAAWTGVLLREIWKWRALSEPHVRFCS